LKKKNQLSAYEYSAGALVQRKKTLQGSTCRGSEKTSVAMAMNKQGA